MKRIILFFSAWVILFSAVAETKITVYVSGQIEEENIKKVFASKIVTAITKVPDYIAVELNENFIGSIRDEHSRQTGGEVSPDDIIEINKKYGSNYIAAIELTVLFDEYFVTSHLIEAETTKIIQAYDTSGPINNMAQLSTLANNVADGLIIAPLREAKAAEEFKRQESERALQQEREKAKELRAQAIKNLKPANCNETKDFYYYEVPINFEIIGGDRPRISESPRAGFYLASENALQDIGNNNLRKTFYILPFEYLNYSKTLKDRRNVYTLNVYSAIRRGLSTLEIITRCDKNGNDTSFDYLEAGISAVYIKYKPDESQIQEEIDRLKKKE